MRIIHSFIHTYIHTASTMTLVLPRRLGCHADVVMTKAPPSPREDVPRSLGSSCEDVGCHSISISISTQEKPCMASQSEVGEDGEGEEEGEEGTERERKKKKKKKRKNRK